MAEEGRVRHGFAALAREHPTLVLTASYLALTTVGLIYNFWLFRFFRINIADYSETSDFLLSAVRTPLVIVLSVLPIFLLMLGQYLRKRGRQRFAAFDRLFTRSRWNTDDPVIRRVVWTLFVIVYAIYFTELYARRVARDIRNGKGQHVTVELMGPLGPASADTTLLLGTTGKYIFLYYPRRTYTRIVPLENVASITVTAKQKRP